MTAELARVNWTPPPSGPHSSDTVMLVAKRQSDGIRVEASEELKENGPWCCPACSTQVSLKKGEVKIHHFAHYPPFSCDYGSGESEEHRWCKTEICRFMRSVTNASKWELERDLDSVRPDVSGYIGNSPVAVEVQASSLGLERIFKRTSEYEKKGIFVLWVVPWRDSCVGDGTDRFSPTVWEKWLHTLYFGRVYYWVGGGFVMPIHFDDYMIYVEEFETDVGFVGGYEKRSKRWRKTKPAPEKILISEMTGSVRNEWKGGKMHVPRARLWTESIPRWW